MILCPQHPRLGVSPNHCRLSLQQTALPESGAKDATSLWVSPQPQFRAPWLSGPGLQVPSTQWGPSRAAPLTSGPGPSHAPFAGLSYRWLLNEFPNFIPTDGRHFVSQTTGNLYIARTNASDLGNYSCLATSHMDFSTKSVFSKFAQLNLAAEGQGWCAGPGGGD